MVEPNYFEKIHRNEITSKRDGKTCNVYIENVSIVDSKTTPTFCLL